VTLRFLCCFGLLAAGVWAQSVGPDSAADTLKSAPPDSVLPYPTKSPGTAVLLSLLIPAGGQVYTHNYWKVPIIAPAELVLGYLSYREHTGAVDALTRGDSLDYVFHRDRRSTFLWFTGATIAFSMADAYVSARMFGFREQMRLSLGGTPPGPAGAPGIRLGVEMAFDP
jgi:hypothetical protein